MWWWRVHDGMGWWMLCGGLLWILFWAMVVFLAVSIFRHDRPDQSRRNPDPIEVATLRYARGEIDREEFETIRKDLKGAA